MHGSSSIADPLLEESPCDNCLLVARCRDERLACDQFNTFFLRGGTGWRLAPRQPSREIFEKVFKPEKPVKTPKRQRKVTAAERSSMFMLRD